MFSHKFKLLFWFSFDQKNKIIIVIIFELIFMINTNTNKKSSYIKVTKIWNEIKTIFETSTKVQASLNRLWCEKKNTNKIKDNSKRKEIIKIIQWKCMKRNWRRKRWRRNRNNKIKSNNTNTMFQKVLILLFLDDLFFSYLSFIHPFIHAQS